MSQYDLNGHDLADLFELTRSSISFNDDCRDHLPAFGSIVYTIWDADEHFIYVGIAGTGRGPRTPLEERNPRSRIQQHASGRRSGDQFCVYVHDFFVVPRLLEAGEYKPARGHLDRLTKDHIRNNLRYRFKVFQTEDSVQIVRALEKRLKRGAFGFPPPVLNGVVLD